MAMQIHMFGGSGRLTLTWEEQRHILLIRVQCISMKWEKGVFLCPSEKTGNIGHGAGGYGWN